GLKAGAVCGIIVNRNQKEDVDLKTLQEVEERMSRVAVQAAKILLSQKDTSN
ncbi:MAG TPA: uridine phosphorylase, partial [Candidatus Atribacteria bacterium]|nr:uridine phosphorylase [Candidatus Atribacteria bacterium]